MNPSYQYGSTFVKSSFSNCQRWKLFNVINQILVGNLSLWYHFLIYCDDYCIMIDLNIVFLTHYKHLVNLYSFHYSTEKETVIPEKL